MTTSAAAAEGPDESMAERLFVEGRVLAARGEHLAACERFEASLKADPSSPGTVLNLALCRERLGHLASAVRHFRSVIQSSRGVREDRAELAEQHLRAIEPKVSTLKIVPGAADVPGATVALDGEPVPRERWGIEQPIDGGSHTIEVAAPGKKTARLSVDVAAEHGRSAIELPLLEQDDVRTPDDARAPDTTRRSLGYVIGGVGAASLVVGAVIGATIASDCGGLFREDCRALVEADAASHRDTERSLSTRATITNVTIGVGVVGIAVGTYLLLTSSRPRAKLSGSVDRTSTRLVLDVAF